MKEKVTVRNAHRLKWPNSLKTIPSGVANYRNLPFSERAMQGSQVRLPRKENARSRHQCLIEENVRKTKEGLWILRIKGSWVVYEGKVLAPNKSGNFSQGTTAFNQICKIMTSNLFYFPFICFYLFWGRQKWGFCSYIFSIAMRNSYLRSSLKSKKVMQGVDFRLLNGSL